MPTGDVEVPAHARRLEPQISLPPQDPQGELLKHDLAERGSERVPPLLDLAAERPARSSVMQWMIMSPRAASGRLALTPQ
jgi:hypothetical protein